MLVTHLVSLPCACSLMRAYTTCAVLDPTFENEMLQASARGGGSCLLCCLPDPHYHTPVLKVCGVVLT